MKRTSLLLLSFLLSIAMIKGADARFVEFPKHSHKENDVPCSRLVLVKEIKPDFNSDLFMVRPIALTSSKERLFIYDGMMKRIYVFNDKHEYIKHFLRAGQGPGESNGQDIGFYKIYSAPDKNLYVCDTFNNKLIVFNQSGDYIRDIRLYNRKSSVTFHPVVDGKGNFYMHADKDEGIVIKYDPKMSKLQTYLQRRHNAEFIVYLPDLGKGVPKEVWMSPDPNNVFYDTIGDDMLLIYLFRSSRVFLFNEKKMVRKIDIIVDKAVERFRKRVNKLIKLGDGRKDFFMTMFHACFVDKDNNRFFYLSDIGEDKNLIIYKFNLNGVLVGVLKGDGLLDTAALLKKNNLFYGINKDMNVRIFREEMNK